jgi:pyruvate dehydrogenase E1 component beta subunit
MGIAVGAAMTGLRPIVELWMSEFMLVAMDQIVNEAPRLRYMSGGQVKVPLVFKAGFGFAAGWAGQHSNCIYHMLMGVPGLKVALPSTPADAKGLMKAAIRDDNPVVYLHHYMLTLDKGGVPEDECVVPLGVADIKRAGSDVTIVATSWMVKKALAAADRLMKEGINAEVIDPRTLAPLDVKTILDSVKKTGRLVLVDQAPRHASAAAIIAAEVADRGFEHLKAPVRMVTSLDTSIPYSEPLENYVLPNEEKIVEAVKFVLSKQVVAA